MHSEVRVRTSGSARRLAIRVRVEAILAATLGVLAIMTALWRRGSSRSPASSRMSGAVPWSGPSWPCSPLLPSARP